MKLKTKKVKIGEAEEEVAEIRDGFPVYLMDDGKEELGDLPSAISKLKQTVEERERLKSKAEEAAANLAPWLDLKVEPAKVRESLDTLSRIDQGKLLDADQIKRVQDEATRQLREEMGAQIKAAQEQANTASAKARSVGIQALLGSLIQAKNNNKEPVYQLGLSTATGVYGPHFLEEDGKWVAYFDPDTKKRPVLSKIPDKFAEKADPQEALRLLVEAHPDREFHLAGAGAVGSGNPPTGVRVTGAGFTISREEARNPAAYRAAKEAAAAAGRELSIEQGQA